MVDSDSLTRTWKVCTKVAAHLEQGQRLENLGLSSRSLYRFSVSDPCLFFFPAAWRIWHVHNLMVESDNAKSKREFKKMTKNMGERLDKEKGRCVILHLRNALYAPRATLKAHRLSCPISFFVCRCRNIEELHAPDFTRTEAIEKLRKRAIEKERSREAGSGINGRGMKGMQYTFSVNPPPSSGIQGKTNTRKATQHTKSLSKSSAELQVQGQDSESVQQAQEQNGDTVMVESPVDPPLSPTSMPLPASPSELSYPNTSELGSSVTNGVLQFPTLFDSDFGPASLLVSAPSFSAPSLSYGEDSVSRFTGHGRQGDFARIPRPTFEFPLDDLMSTGDAESWSTGVDSEMMDASNSDLARHNLSPATPIQLKQEPVLHSISMGLHYPRDNDGNKTPPSISSQSEPTSPVVSSVATSPPSSATHSRKNSRTSREENNFLPPAAISVTRAVTRNSANHHSNNAESSSTSSSTRQGSGRQLRQPPSATPPPRGMRAYGNTAPGGVKSECANCGANSTPLWRRGLNDELNCNVRISISLHPFRSSRLGFQAP